jgi:methylase of polypeptide subunit release factors
MLFSQTDVALLELARALRDDGYAFTTTTPATHERVNGRLENALACDLQGVFGWSRPFAPDVLPPHVWKLMQEADIAARHGDAWKSTLRLSSLDGQMFWHSAYPTVEGDAVFFGPDTYRYANALREHFATDTREVRRAIDIGCGAGPGAILTAQARPNAQVFAVDINERALRLTRVNSALNEVSNVEARYSDLLSAVEDDFDLIVANPPYLVDPKERAYRHGGGPLGADLSLAIVDAAHERLAPGGTLLLYTGVAMIDRRDPFREAVAQRLGELSWTYRESDPDVFGEELESGVYASCDRIAAVVLTARRAE